MTVLPPVTTDCPATHSLVMTPDLGEDTHAIFRRLRERLHVLRASVVKQTVFGSCDAHAEAMECIDALQTDGTWPVTWVEGADVEGRSIAGIQVEAVTGVEVRTLWHDGRPMGRYYDDDAGRHVYLADVRPPCAGAARPEQALLTFRAMQQALAQVGVGFEHVARTWLFIDEILEWYAAFNAARDRFLAECGVSRAVAPASTGIGCANPHWTALAAETYAFRPAPGVIGAVPVASPLQCPAPAYGSAFSRAVDVPGPRGRRTLVSGTAAIAPGGESVCPGDVDAQVARTLEVVGALLAERGLGLRDVTRGIAYFRRAEDAPALQRAVDAGLLPPMPLIVVRADVCRDELLFEIEVDAARAAAQ